MGGNSLAIKLVTSSVAGAAKSYFNRFCRETKEVLYLNMKSFSSDVKTLANLARAIINFTCSMFDGPIIMKLESS